MISRYQDRISGPLLDRIDMRVEVSSLPDEVLTAMPDGEPTRFVAERVRTCLRPVRSHGRAKINDHLQGAELEEVCMLDEPVQKLLHAASVRLGWSARAYHRVLKVARTIADLAGVGAPRNAARRRGDPVPARAARGVRRSRLRTACPGTGRSNCCRGPSSRSRGRAPRAAYRRRRRPCRSCSSTSGSAETSCGIRAASNASPA